MTPRGRILVLLVLLGAVATSSPALAQADSVDVTFYYRPSGFPNIVYLPGEFNGWQLNRNTQMFLDPATNIWSKTVRLRVGGPLNPQSIEGAYQYKFNENGTNWLSDPLNPRQNRFEFNNSVLYTHDPTIHYLLPNSVSGLVTETHPEISAYIFPAVGAGVDTATLRLFVDGVEYTHLGAFFDSTEKKLSFRLPDALSPGSHTLKLVAGSTTGRSSADSTEFVSAGGFVQILNQSNPRYLRPSIRIDGTVQDPAITSGTLFHNGTPIPISISSGAFSQSVDLIEGDNVFRAVVTDAGGQEQESAAVTITYVVDHAPRPAITASVAGPSVIFSATGNDPDGDPVTFQWRSEDDRNPIPLSINAGGVSVAVPIPAFPGRYHLRVEASDPNGNKGSARAYFEVETDGGVVLSSVNSNPGWVRDAVIYEIFLPAFTAEGTFAAAVDRLPWIKSLGANVIWLMPIYENSETINELNAGYNITDFFQVHAQLGTMADFEGFLAAAHDLGIRVILDITPNHVSDRHPWVEDIRLFRDYSNYRPHIESRLLGDDRDLGQFRTTIDGYTLYVHYSDWALANLNYSNIETVVSMLDVFKWWVLQKGIDGYRMDVYWGPQNRYGSSAWWRPFREEIKRVEPDLLILGETDGTGIGSEDNYADGGGACDAAYDWPLFGEFKSVLNNGSLNNFDNRVRNFSPNLNYNHFTGPNAHYFRFLENHDEIRIAADVGLSKSKAGAAALLTIPGIPLIYAGQEVGETSRRGRVNWNRPGAEATFVYYQRLVQIRNRFATFRSPRIKRVNAGASRVYAFLRPNVDENAVVAINFSASPTPATLALNESDLQLSADSLRSGQTYYLNDVLNDTAYTVTKSTLSSFTPSFPAWGARVFIFADTLIQLTTEVESPPVAEVPGEFTLQQNYPNPFWAAGSVPGNGSYTTLRYTLTQPAEVLLEIYNLRGERVATVVRGAQPAGEYQIPWKARGDDGRELSAGIYFARLRAGNVVRTVRMVVLR